MRKHWILMLLAAFLVVSSPSCTKKIGCPVNDDTTPKFDGSKRKKGKTKSGLTGKQTKYKKRKH